MFHFKGFYVWYNSLQGKWLIQTGYEIQGRSVSEKGAKRIINRWLAKEATQ